MRTLYFLVPGTTGKFVCGGLFAELKTLKLAQQICDAAIVTYRQREADTLFLKDLLPQKKAQDGIFVVSWGFDVPKLIRQLQAQKVLYHAHSAGYGFKVPPTVPILAVSRNTMGYWGQQCPGSPLYYLPNEISSAFTNQGVPRDIDVLVQARKSSEYLLTQLVPALQNHCHVVVLDRFVDDLAQLFNRARVYLYDSAEYWAQYRVSEGFGLPPLEAMACGCQVFASVNGALADYLDPAFNCQQIGVHSTSYDVKRILNAVQNAHPVMLPTEFFEPYRDGKLVQRLQHILLSVNDFFDHAEYSPSNVLPLSPLRLTRLRMQRLGQKLRSKLS